MQASLASNPVETDWFDIGTTKTSYIYNPTNTTSTVATTFVGNFTWVRAKVEIGQGTLLGIKYNY
jgi:hypothetical protein